MFARVGTVAVTVGLLASLAIGAGSAPAGAVVTQVIAAGTSATNLPTETVWPGAQNPPYICCWGTQGQFVTFSFSVAGGSTTLALRYSAGNGIAHRKIELDGSVLVANQAFAAHRQLEHLDHPHPQPARTRRRRAHAQGVVRLDRRVQPVHQPRQSHRHANHGDTTAGEYHGTRDLRPGAERADVDRVDGRMDEQPDVVHVRVEPVLADLRRARAARCRAATCSARPTSGRRSP